MSWTRTPAIDCGTNTIKLLIGDLPGGGGPRESRMVRLGQGVDRTGTARRRGAGAGVRRDRRVRRADPARTTSPAGPLLRDLGDPRRRRTPTVFVEGVRERLGVEPEVLSGDEEAALAFDGAVRNLRDDSREPVLVVDIGGGSTELVLGDATGPRPRSSMDIGSVRLHERHLHADPPTAARGRRLRGRHRRPPRRLPGARRATRPPWSASPAPSTRSPPAVLDLTATTTSVDRPVRGSPSTDVHASVERLVAMTVAERLALPLDAPRPRRRASAPAC